MQTKNQKIRNARGSLVCEVFYDGDCWVIGIKKKGVYTFITLYDNGSIRIINDDDNNSVKIPKIIPLATK